MAGEEHTIVGPHVQAPFESPEGVHLLDRRVFRRSQVVHCKRAQCELRDYGPVRMSTSGRIRVNAGINCFLWMAQPDSRGRTL